MKKISLLFVALVLCAAYAISPKIKSKPTVGIIVPMEHAALTQIIEGFKKELADQNIQCKVFNAQGDQNIQKTIIQKLIQEDCDLFVPIGTSTSQMTLNLAKDHRVLCLAANQSVISGRKKATVLDDTFSAKDSLSFLHTAFPDIKKITLIYSSSEKVAEEVLIVEKAGAQFGIEVQKLMVHSMADLYTISQNISQDSQALFILKDHLIVSGIATLAKQAEKRNIFLMTSDEGSISSGAAFAIGIKESSIGVQGAKIAKTVFQGHSPEEIAPQTLTGPFFLFINEVSCVKQGIKLPSLLKKAEERGLTVEYKERE